MPVPQSLPFYAKGSHTSWKAAQHHAAATKARGAKLAHLMAAYRKAGSRGLTDAEASRKLTLACECLVPVQSVCSLRANLMQQGLVGKGGEREGDYGRAVTVHIWIGGAK